jgi:hypothetical protein
MPTLPWIVPLAIFILIALVFGIWMIERRPKKPIELPREWTLTARPVFTTDERRAYRLLREALPHHVVLSKLPLVRLCQPVDPNEVRYWFELLATGNVTFAVCSANGRVLVAIDLDNDRASSVSRSVQIKRAVLNACRVHYLRYPSNQMPTVEELQLLVKNGGNPPAQHASASSTTNALNRPALWRDSSDFNDSFFAPDSRNDFSNSGFSPLAPGSSAGDAKLYTSIDELGSSAAASSREVGGVVVDTAPTPSAVHR